MIGWLPQTIITCKHAIYSQPQIKCDAYTNYSQRKTKRSNTISSNLVSLARLIYKKRLNFVDLQTNETWPKCLTLSEFIHLQYNKF